MGLSWQAMAPPLNPPDEAGLPEAYAAEIAAGYWETDPWLALALMWEAFAATLPPEPVVVSVSTGAQTVGYSGGGGGPFAQALARAEWFRGQRGSLVSIQLGRGGGPGEPWPADWWQRNYGDPP